MSVWNQGFLPMINPNNACQVPQLVHSETTNDPQEFVPNRQMQMSNVNMSAEMSVPTTFQQNVDQRPGKRYAQKCLYWDSGSCKYGEGCRFRHDPHQMVPDPSQMISKPSQMIFMPGQNMFEPSQMMFEPSHVISEPSQVMFEPGQMINFNQGMISIEQQSTDMIGRRLSHVEYSENIRPQLEVPPHNQLNVSKFNVEGSAMRGNEAEDLSTVMQQQLKQAYAAGVESGRNMRSSDALIRNLSQGPRPGKSVTKSQAEDDKKPDPIFQDCVINGPKPEVEWCASTEFAPADAGNRFYVRSEISPGLTERCEKRGFTGNDTEEYAKFLKYRGDDQPETFGHHMRAVHSPVVNMASINNGVSQRRPAPTREIASQPADLMNVPFYVNMNESRERFAELRQMGVECIQQINPQLCQQSFRGVVHQPPPPPMPRGETGPQRMNPSHPQQPCGPMSQATFQQMNMVQCPSGSIYPDRFPDVADQVYLPFQGQNPYPQQVCRTFQQDLSCCSRGLLNHGSASNIPQMPGMYKNRQGDFSNQRR